MSVLSDRDIRTHLRDRTDGYAVGMRPLPSDQVIQPASVDLSLGDEWITYPETHWEHIDLDDVHPMLKLYKSTQYILAPGEFILGTTEEFVEIPHDVVAVVNGKSSLARIGLLIHITAGFIDPGFKGKVTLEIVNLNKMPIILRAGKPICQISFMQLSSPALYPYGHPSRNSKYQNQEQVQGSLYEG